MKTWGADISSTVVDLGISGQLQTLVALPLGK